MLAKEYQSFFHKDAKNNDTAECLCNARECAEAKRCDVVLRQEHCQSGNDPNNADCLCNINTSQSIENTENDTLILRNLIEKTRYLEQKMEAMENVLEGLKADRRPHGHRSSAESNALA